MSRISRLARDERGATIVEMAFALPTFVVLLWSMTQLGLVYRANSGIQQALGQGARFATLYPTPSNADIDAKMAEAVYGIGPGDFTHAVTDPVDDPETEDVDESKAGYKDLSVSYTQKTDLLLFPGPTVKVNKSKRVWVANSAGASGTGTGGSSGGSSGEPTPDPTPEPDPDPTPDPTPGPTPTPDPTPPTTSPGQSGTAPGQVECKKANKKPC